MVSSGRQTRSLRLVLVTETFPPEVNGVAQVLGRWVQTFRQRGHHVQVVRPARPAREDDRSGYQVVGVPLPFYPEVRFGLSTPARLTLQFQKWQPDLVHLATEGPLGWAALMSARGLRLPVTSSFHTNFDGYLRHYGLDCFAGWSSAYLRWFHNLCTATFVPSLTTRDRLMSLRFRDVEVWSRGVDGERFNPEHRDLELRRNLGVGPNDVLVLYVGRLAAEKNLPALVEAFARVRQQLGPDGERARLVMVGGGPLASALRQARVPGVVFPGVQIGYDLARFYASADLFVFPSLTETFGNVILEAMASGLPVIGVDCPVVRERITHRHDGVLVPRDGDLAIEITQLIRDTALRQRLGLAARKTAESQGWEPIFDRLEDRYLELAAPRRTGSSPAYESSFRFASNSSQRA